MARDEKTIATFFWRRLDTEGHDSCQLLRRDDGWRLRGGAAFLDDDRACHLAYEVTCDATWRTKAARVVGHMGARAVELRIARSPAGWLLNGVLQPATKDRVDVDLAFTPATNLLPIRRLALRVGESAQAPAAWLDLPKLRLVRLPQTYRRVGRGRYEYSAPTVGYRGTLEVSHLGAILLYPELFESVG